MFSPKDGSHGARLRHSSQGADRGRADPRRRAAAGPLAQHHPALRAGQGRPGPEAGGSHAATTPAREQVAEAAASIWAARRTFTAGKQRLTATRLWELLRDDGHEVSGRTVRRLVASFRNAEREVTVPLVYAPGELAQVDFFEVWVEVESVRQKAWLFLMRLMHSGRDFAMVCAQQDTTWFLAAHVAAFTHFAGRRRGRRIRQPQRRGRQDPHRRAARRAPALRRDGRPLRARSSLLPTRRRTRQGRRREPWRAHPLAALGADCRAVRASRTSAAALQVRLDAQHARDAARSAAWERRASRASCDARALRWAQVRTVQLRHHASHAVAGGAYSVPSRWCGHAVDLFVGTDSVSFAYGDEVVRHPRVPFGGRSVDYRHLLLPLSRKPQALRQVVHELVAQFGSSVAGALGGSPRVLRPRRA